MNRRTRLLLLLVAAVGGALVAVLGAVHLLSPRLVAHGPSPSAATVWIGAPAADAVTVAAGLAAVTVAVLALRDRRSAHDRPPVLLRAAAVGVALVVATVTPGGLIPIAGYSFVLVVAAAIVGGVVLLMLRRPVVGLAVAAVAVAVIILVSRGLPLGSFGPMVLSGLADRIPVLTVALAHLVTAGALAAWTVGEPRASGRLDGWLLRHRRGVTVAAASCALPYTLVRASWLTPWPLLAPPDIAAHPDALMTGLLLGGAMLAGGLLTLLLCLPWADRFPRWLGLVGGRPVPVALAVIPASFVGVLFTTGSLEFAADLGVALGLGVVMLVFPFWLWGPLLLLAARGYTLHRAAPFARTGDDDPVADRMPRPAASTPPPRTS